MEKTKDKPTITFYASFAGVPVKVNCYFEETKRFCKDYLIEPCKEAFCVEISREAFPALAKLADQTAVAEGRKPCVHYAETFLEMLALHKGVSDRLPEFDRVLFHCSSIRMEGKAVAFTAPSGTGKSTHVKLWKQVYGDAVENLNDDKPFVGIEDGEVRLFGAPWQGKHNLGARIDAPLQAIGVITRSETNHVEQVPPGEVFPILLRQMHRPSDKQLLVKTLAIIKKIAEEIPVYYIYCNMDPDAAKTSHDGIFGSFNRWQS